MDITLALELFISIFVIVIVLMQVRKSLVKGWNFYRWKLWVVWNLVTVIGLILSLTIWLYTLYFNGQALQGPNLRIEELPFSTVLEVALPTGAISGLLGGFFIGSFQWLVMRSKINQASRWIWATSIGWALGESLITPLLSSQRNIPYTGLASLALSGVFVGIAQWLVLRREVHKAGWWILANVVGWTGLIIPQGIVTGFALLYLFKRPNELRDEG